MDEMQNRPRFAELADLLRPEIADGRYPVGAKLPTEAELGERFSVGRHTVREAIRLLREEGLVECRRGAGTIVVPRNPTQTFRLEAQSINDLVAYAADLYTRIDSISPEIIGEASAARIGGHAGEEWLVVRGIVHTKSSNRAICASEYYINRAYASVGRLIPRQTGPVFLLIEDMFAVRITELDQDISGSEVDHRLADALGIPSGAAAIDVRRTYRTSDGVIAQISVHSHPAARFHQSIRMHRMQS